MDIDLRRLRYFVTVARELSFVRAASLLHMTQPALSRQIGALEHDLGTRLLDRDRRGTSLTPAGRQLLEDAVPLLAASVALQRRTRLAGRDAAHFTIGFMPGVQATPIIREFARLAPRLSIDVVHTTVTDQLPYLLDGRVDVCFVRLPLPEESLKVVPLFPEPRVVALPATHPLADAPSVALAKLHDLPLLQDRAEVPEWHGPVTDLAPPPGQDHRRPPTIEESLQRVALGLGVFVLPAGIAGFYRRDDVRCVPLEDVAPGMVALAQGRHRTMPELDRFARLAISMLGPGGSGPAPE
ncbi:LysR family transcriptional regulator [Streptomyces sp. NPDC058417]|uniref:LysR family transcriptional regulator n=1 Tax=unclassified Streptomyces TaxID=2593676 RepID=UPI003649C5FD